MVCDLTRRFTGEAFFQLWGNKDGLRPTRCFDGLPREVFYLSSNHHHYCLERKYHGCYLTHNHSHSGAHSCSTQNIHIHSHNAE